ncbi:YcxB family protein [Chloroflexota bacterium]
MGFLTGDLIPTIGSLVLIILVYSFEILRMGLSSKNRNFFLTRRFIFSDEDVSSTTPLSQGVVKWDAFIKWKKIAGFYVIYLSSESFLAIHKSHIPVQDIPAFEELLQNKITETEARRWTWRIKGLLTFIIILSLAWLLTIFVAYIWEYVILYEVSGILIAIVIGIPVALLVAEFCMLLYGKRSGSRNKTIISAILLFITIAGMIAVILDIFIFNFYMY